MKPLPNGSVYVAYATSANPVGAEFDGTSTAYGGSGVRSSTAAINQIFGPEKNKAIELGTKWELFDRHLLVTGALFQTNKDNAREAQNVGSAAAAAAVPGCSYPAGTTGNVSCITAGAAYRIRGIDLGVGGKITDKWSVFGGLVLMESEVTKSLAPSADPILYPTNVGLPLANVAHQSFSMLTKYQLTDVWELGGQAVYRSKIYGGTLAGRQPGHVDSELLALRCLRGSQDQQELEGEAVRQQHLQQALLRRAVSERGAVRAGSAGPHRVAGDLGEVLISRCDADLRSRCAEQGRCGGFPPHHGRLRLGRRPLHRRRAVGAGQEERAIAAGQRDVARKLGNRIVSALTANPRFISAAIPLQIFPPLFNRYAAADGHHFGIHVDNAVRGDHLTGLRIRTDLSVTLFLSEPDEYDGGELVVEDNYGSHEIKLPAGDLVLYPASSLHMVTPVTRGTRVASFFWLQSMIRDAHARSLIFDLDTAIQALVERLGRDDPETVKLTGIYHNLIRYWAEV